MPVPPKIPRKTGTESKLRPRRSKSDGFALSPKNLASRLGLGTSLGTESSGGNSGTGATGTVGTESRHVPRPGFRRFGPLAAWLSFPFRAFQRVCMLLGAMVLLLSGLVTAGLVQFFWTLPPVEQMSFADLQATGMERTVARLENPKSFYRWTPIRDTSRAFIYSVVSSEDATFFDHDGFNFEAILDSLAENIRDRKNSYGASTISQQVAKNLFLTSEKSWIRKAKEFFITRALERKFKKNEILEIYLNIAEFGPDVYGVAAASRLYFGLLPEDINAAEGSFIALMLPSPKRHYFSIFENQNLSRAKRRRLERVLRGMLYEELITESQYRSFNQYDFFSYKRTGKPRAVPVRNVASSRNSRRKR
jgi:monofunctional glycosyltransferase